MVCVVLPWKLHLQLAEVLYWVMWPHSALRLTRLSCGVLWSPTACPPETLTVTAEARAGGGGGGVAGVVLAPCSIQSLPVWCVVSTLCT